MRGDINESWRVYGILRLHERYGKKLEGLELQEIVEEIPSSSPNLFAKVNRVVAILDLTSFVKLKRVSSDVA